MRAFLLLALAPLALFAGCLESTVSTTDIREDGSSSSSVICRNGDCEVCVEDQCAPCEQSECEECRDGDCPAFGRAAAARAAAGPPEDVEVQETYPLTFGLSETSWSFDVVEGATGHVRFTVADVATGMTSLMSAICVQYEIDGLRGNYQKSSAGNCSTGTANVVVSGNSGSPHTFLAWDDLSPGHYRLTASAQPQANNLVVDIVVDNT